jgi:hypothetical protein
LNAIIRVQHHDLLFSIEASKTSAPSKTTQPKITCGHHRQLYNCIGFSFLSLSALLGDLSPTCQYVGLRGTNAPPISEERSRSISLRRTRDCIRISWYGFELQRYLSISSRRGIAQGENCESGAVDTDTANEHHHNQTRYESCTK